MSIIILYDVGEKTNWKIKVQRIAELTNHRGLLLSNV